MKVLVAIASAEQQHVGSIQSCYMLHRRDGDRIIASWLYRGDVARESLVNEFLTDDYFGDEDAILMLDADQRHPEDMLEILRAHDLPMVCAHYYRRETSPVQSLCFELGDGTWPFLPYQHPPSEGLHEIAATGFGCVLIKKKVLKAVQAGLPYGMSPVAIAPMPELSGDHANFGPDFRFFHLARKAGYKLYLDASVESLHAVTLWLGHKSAELLADPIQWADAAQQVLLLRLERDKVSNLEAYKQRKRILEARLEGVKEQALIAGRDGREKEWRSLSVSVLHLEGKIMEINAWIEWAEKYPAIERPDQLPTTESMAKQETIPDEVADEATAKAQRQQVYKDNAADLVDMLPDVEHGTGQ